MKFILKYFFLLILVSSFGAGQSVNILKNYNNGFESGLDANWRFFEVPSSAGSTAASTTDAVEGTKALLLTFASPSGITDRALDNWNTNVQVTAGTPYTFSVQAKSPDATVARLQVTIGFFNSSHAVLSQATKTFTLTTSYQPFSTTAIPPANAVTCWIAFRLKNSTNSFVAGSLYLDDVQLNLPAPPGPSGRTTLTGKLMCGYQGWFSVPTDAINRGWYHYQYNGLFEPGSCKIDLWPDLTEMDADEKYAAPGFTTASGAQAYVFSSQNPKTVKRHFQWMHDYGIDGVFIQRFATAVMNGGVGLTQWNNVLTSCRDGAHQYGRIFAVMYDLSGIKAGDWKKVLTDWQTQIVNRNVLQDSCYLFHNGKPVVAVWGIGFNDGREYTLSECLQLVDSLKDHPQYGGNTVMIGVPKGWRTLNGDAVTNDTLTTIALKADIVSPWLVGRYNSLSGVTTYANSVATPDIAWCNTNGKEFLPVAFPGFSWHNGHPTYPLDQISRQGGQFLWQQYYDFIRVGSKMLYQAMFDEIDEGTAIFKVTNDPPVGASSFVTYGDLPSDFYLRLVGRGTQMLRGEISLSSNLPDTSKDGLPVELNFFSAQATAEGIKLRWSTATEVNNYGFEVERRTKNNEQSTNNSWAKIGFIEGTGNSNSPKSYSFVDAHLTDAAGLSNPSGKVLYRLKQIDRDGKFVYGNVLEVAFTNSPKEFSLDQNYPNPFNPTTLISYQLPMTSHVALRVYNVLGREVATLADGIRTAGVYTVHWDAKNISGGVYFYRLQTANRQFTKRMILVR